MLTCVLERRKRVTGVSEGTQVKMWWWAFGGLSFGR
jgi:hypothetical protein